MVILRPLSDLAGLLTNFTEFTFTLHQRYEINLRAVLGPSTNKGSILVMSDPGIISNLLAWVFVSPRLFCTKGQRFSMCPSAREGEERLAVGLPPSRGMRPRVYFYIYHFKFYIFKFRKIIRLIVVHCKSFYNFSTFGKAVLVSVTTDRRTDSATLFLETRS